MMARHHGAIALPWFGWAIASAILYLITYGEASLLQLGVGLLIGALAATLVLAVKQIAGLHFAPGWMWPLPLITRVPFEVARDCALVNFEIFRLALGHQVRGAFLYSPLEAGAANTEAASDSAAAAKRGLTILNVSLTPNSLAIAADPRRGRLLIHQMSPTTASRKVSAQEELP